MLCVWAARARLARILDPQRQRVCFSKAVSRRVVPRAVHLLCVVLRVVLCVVVSAMCMLRTLERVAVLSTVALLVYLYILVLFVVFGAAAAPSHLVVANAPRRGRRCRSASRTCGGRDGVRRRCWPCAVSPRRVPAAHIHGLLSL